MYSPLIVFALLAFVLNFDTIQVSADIVAITDEVILEITKNDITIGSISLGLFGRRFPEIVRNFVTLSSDQGFNGKSYRDTILEASDKKSVLGGDISGTGGLGVLETIYDEPINYPAVESRLKLIKGGLLAAANYGTNTMGSAFVLTTKAMKREDNLIVYGQLLDNSSLFFLRYIVDQLRKQRSQGQSSWLFWKPKSKNCNVFKIGSTSVHPLPKPRQVYYRPEINGLS